MLYVERDSDGKIREMHPMPFGDACEALPADHPEVLQFIHERWRQNELNELDRDFVRVIEDTIELLIAKDLIMFTDLPLKVQEKLMRRKEVRQLKHYEGRFGTGGDDIIPL
ncbi:MAG: hypothetical protein H6R14_2437 [Proteobacteria bacterium]|nr:hypothetical protein [Pseudomonadota bacterium]